MLNTQDYLTVLLNEEAVLLPEFRDAFIGICHRPSLPPVATYSIPKILETLCSYGLSRNEAKDVFETEVLGKYHDGNDPVFIEV